MTQKKVAKIPKLKADCYALDCEDGVAANKKVSIFLKYFLLIEGSSQLFIFRRRLVITLLTYSTTNS